MCATTTPPVATQSNILDIQNDWDFKASESRLSLPRLMALTKMVKARMKMIKEARPRSIISLRIMCWSVKAAMIERNTKYATAETWTLVSVSRQIDSTSLAVDITLLVLKCWVRTKWDWKTMKQIILDDRCWWWECRYKCWCCTGNL